MTLAKQQKNWEMNTDQNCSTLNTQLKLYTLKQRCAKTLPSVSDDFVGALLAGFSSSCDSIASMVICDGGGSKLLNWFARDASNAISSPRLAMMPSFLTTANISRVWCFNITLKTSRCSLQIAAAVPSSLLVFNSAYNRRKFVQCKFK